MSTPPPSSPPSSRIPRRAVPSQLPISNLKNSYPETTERQSDYGCLSRPPTHLPPLLIPKPSHQSPNTHSRKLSASSSHRSVSARHNQPTPPTHHSQSTSTTSTTSTTVSSTTTLDSPSHSTYSTHSQQHQQRKQKESPRPKLAPRDPSHVYTTFDLRPPMSPSEEVDHSGGLRGWLGLSPKKADEESRADGERTRLLRSTSGERARAQRSEADVGAEERERDGEVPSGKEGLPKLSRECLVAEIKCYGSYMLPPILFFVVFVLGLSLWLYNNAIAEP
ncbi:hypothetical protein P7C70_g5276, partial [Phenoliferia sp. Uapishka_3]